MNFPSAKARRRVQWLLRCYPKDWRSRYGDEFTELLVAEMTEQPRSRRRSTDVVWSGLVARISEAGLGGRRLEPVDQVRRCLVSLGCALAVFLAFGIAIWAQLTIGWQWSEPDTATTSAAMIVMSCALLAFFALAVAAAIPNSHRLEYSGACGASGSRWAGTPVVALVGESQPVDPG